MGCRAGRRRRHERSSRRCSARLPAQHALNPITLAGATSRAPPGRARGRRAAVAAGWPRGLTASAPPPAPWRTRLQFWPPAWPPGPFKGSKSRVYGGNPKRERGIIIRVSGVRVPPPASRSEPNSALQSQYARICSEAFRPQRTPTNTPTPDICVPSCVPQGTSFCRRRARGFVANWRKTKTPGVYVAYRLRCPAQDGDESRCRCDCPTPQSLFVDSKPAAWAPGCGSARWG
jgi:hypothetical protein